MASLKFLSSADLLPLISLRQGEVKLGENFRFVSDLDQLQSSTSKFVLIGLPEDIGVKANFGIQGTAAAWKQTVTALSNIQQSQFLDGAEVLLLGFMDFASETEAADRLNPAVATELSELRSIVSHIDDAVYDVLLNVFLAGKIPIVIGGGHNNCYPILKAYSTSSNQGINTINIDAHADFRSMEGRHSGNGFRYAFEEGFLEKYAVLGLHENYNSQATLDALSQNPQRIKFIFLDDLLRETSSFDREFQALLNFTAGKCGLEIDMDAVSGVLASASSLSGFQLNQVRELLALSRTSPLGYLHICEAAPSLADGRADPGCGKNIAYLISDFIKSQRHHHL